MAGRVSAEAGATLNIPGEHLCMMTMVQVQPCNYCASATGFCFVIDGQFMDVLGQYCGIRRRWPAIRRWTMTALCIQRQAVGAAFPIVSLLSLRAAGWVYAEMTTEDTLALRGLSLQLQSIRAHLEAARIEEYLDLKPSLRFPYFYEVPA